MNPFSVIKKPLLSEKSNECRERDQAYTFAVQLTANKGDIKSAVEKMFDVKVRSVNTCITRGKLKRKGYNVSMTPKVKKAVVKLAEGQTLKIFEDQ